MAENQYSNHISDKGSPEKLSGTRRKKRQSANCDTAKIVYIDTLKIKPNRAQPRMYFESNATIRLADSIRRYGILQPLTVRLSEKNRFCIEAHLQNEITKSDLGQEAPGKCQNFGFPSSDTTEPPDSPQFELVAGERRFRAAQMLGMKSVPCIIIEADDKKSAELALIENLLREDLNIFETASAIEKLIKTFELTQEEVAKRLSMSQSAVANKLRLLKFSEKERKMLLKYALTERHARALLKFGAEEKRIAIMEHIVAYRLNVSATEAYIERLIEEESDYKEPDEVQAPRKKPIIKDIRLFYNSVEHAVDIVKAAGIEILSNRREDENGVLIEIRIPHPRIIA